MTSLESADPRGRRAGGESALERRALALWPRLERASLRRCHQDPRRIALLVARRTSLEVEAIVRLLTVPSVSDEEVATWFG